MPKYLSTNPTFYPAYCFSLSPTYNTWARLTSADVHALKELSGFEGMHQRIPSAPALLEGPGCLLLEAWADCASPSKGKTSTFTPTTQYNGSALWASSLLSMFILHAGS